MFSNSKFLLFADNLKIFKLVSSESDALSLQSDLRMFEDWYRRNNLRINADKCHVIRFSCGKCATFNYSLNDTDLLPINAVRDLGVVIDSSLTFSQHVDYIFHSAMKNVGFLQRFSTNFSNDNAQNAVLLSRNSAS